MTHLRQACVLAAVIVLATTAPAYAYLDPGTGSIILQAILGGLAMGAVTARLYWAKLKSFFMRRQPSHRERPDHGKPAA
jgi:hypothetical protein